MLEKSEADEFWTCNWSYNYDWIGQIDRLFEVHPVWLYANLDKAEWIKPKEHWDWLTKHIGYPVYLQRKLDAVPSSVQYPIEEVTEEFFGNRFLTLMKDGSTRPHSVYGSSMDYMMGMALREGFDEIELIGIEMGSSTEYRYQRESFAVWTGMALGRGHTVIRPGNSALFNIKRYGYEGGQMIFRQDLERLFHWQEKEKAILLARVQQMEGRMQEAQRDEEKLLAMANEYRDLRDQLMISIGWGQCLAHEIQDIDLEEVEPQIVNPIKTM
jgi:hypothetical protein